MKPYYVMIRFAGPYVTGFIVPQAYDEYHALKILKKIIWARIQVSIDMGINLERHMGDDNVPRLKEYMRSLKRPWRLNGENRTNGEKKAVCHDRSRNRVVNITELQLPVHAGYWLKGIVEGQTLCNIPTTWEPRPRR